MKASNYNIFKTINGSDYLYNSLTKSVIRLSDREAFLSLINDIENNQQSSASKATIDKLIDNGILIDDDTNEICTLEYGFNKMYFANNTFTVILIPGYECNFCCPYCFEAGHKHDKSHEHYFKIMEKFAHTYFHLYHHVEISMFGGEPLLFFNDYKHLLETTREITTHYKTTYSCSLTTNGSLISSEIISTLNQHFCKSIQITLDGSKRTHDTTRMFNNNTSSFDLLISKINNELREYYNKSEVSFYLRINLNNNTVEDIEEALTLIDEDIRPHIILTIRAVYNTESYEENNSNSTAHLLPFYEIGRKLGFKISHNKYDCRSCEACSYLNTIYVAPDMRVWKCANAIGTNSGRIGRICDDGILELDNLESNLWYTAANCFTDPKCRNCKLLPDCFGGCILHNAINKERLCTSFDLMSLPFFYL